MIYPRFLKKGDCIGIPAPSSGAYNKIYENRYTSAISKLNQMGYKLKVSPNINVSLKARSASAEERGNEVNAMFNDDETDFIICAAGGEFLVESLPYIDFEKISKNPKFIEGFSDPTGILFPLTTKYDIATIYGANFGDYGCEKDTQTVKDNLKIITGDLIEQKNSDLYQEERLEDISGLEAPNLTKKVEWKYINCNNVNVEGRIIGGCIDIISELAGTKYDGVADFIEKYKKDGILWYFDNCELSKEELIRTLWKFNELGYFKYTKCVIFGRNGEEKSCLGYSMKECLLDSVIGKKDIPIIYDADFSHKDPCLTVINGSIATVKSQNGCGTIKFNLI